MIRGLARGAGDICLYHTKSRGTGEPGFGVHGFVERDLLLFSVITVALFYYHMVFDKLLKYYCGRDIYFHL